MKGNTHWGPGGSPTQRAGEKPCTVCGTVVFWELSKPCICNECAAKVELVDVRKTAREEAFNEAADYLDEQAAIDAAEARKYRGTQHEWTLLATAHALRTEAHQLRARIHPSRIIHR